MRVISRLRLQAVLLLLAAVAFYYRIPLHEHLGLLSEEGWARVTETLIGIAAAALVNGVLVRLIWHGEGQAEAPRLLRQVVAIGVWVFAVIVVVTVVFGRSITDLVTASSVMVATVGLSVRTIIADLFYGVALAIERPFEIGDWVQVDEKTIGEVTEINWRSTRLVTRDLISVVVPNSVLAGKQFRNFSRPTPYWRHSMRIRLGRDVPPAQGERLLLSAIRQVPESAVIPHSPEARIVDFSGDTVDWELRYWINDYPNFAMVDDQIRRAVLHNLQLAGIQLPRSSHQLFIQQSSEGSDLDHWLERVDLFAGIEPHERQELATVARRHLAVAGMAVVRQGDPGASLFVLIEGHLQVQVSDSRGQQRVIGAIAPGGVFGEISLLTGAPRTATVVAMVNSVVYEITKEELEPYLHRHPMLAEQMSRILAERQNANNQNLEEPIRDAGRAQESLAEQFLGRIRNFFGLRDGNRATG